MYTLFAARGGSLVVASDPGAGTFSSPLLITSPGERAQLPPRVNSTTLRRDLHVHDHFHVHEKSLLSSILSGFARPRVKKRAEIGASATHKGYNKGIRWNKKRKKYETRSLGSGRADCQAVGHEADLAPRIEHRT